MTNPKPAVEMTRKELRDEIKFIAECLGKGSIGSTVASRSRIAAVIREAARRMRPDKEDLE